MTLFCDVCIFAFLTYKLWPCSHKIVYRNHYNGMFDPVWDIDKEITKLNAEKGWQVGIHVDAAR